MNLDDVRAKFPHLALALYAFEPKGPVTLECIAPDGSIYKFEGATEHDAVMRGFGDDLSPAAVKEPTPASNIFD